MTIMSSIVTAVFKASIGLLVNKGRAKAAEKLKDGDVTDQKFRGLIVREIDDIKSKLDGLSRKDLLASISFFKEGIELLYEVFDKARSRSEDGEVTTQAACAEGLSFARGMRKLDLTDLDESATRKLSDAKKRFKDARKEATRAFNNESLNTSDRILAMQYRVMATILEKVDSPADALAPCRVCIDELHCLPAVQECFNVELTRSFRSLFGKGERRKNICNVCHVNFVIHGITLMVCFGNKELPVLPCIGSGEDKLDPLRDERVTRVLREQGMKYRCATPWSFGQEGEEEQKLKEPCGITTNSSGQFIVGEGWDSNVMVFDNTGAFMKLFGLSDDHVLTKSLVLDVATDINDNIYVLVRLNVRRERTVVYKFNNTAGLQHKFPVSGDQESWDKLVVTESGKILVLCSKVVSVYETDGQFVYSFRRDILRDDVTAANDGRVMVVDRGDSFVHIFSEHGDHLNKFKLQRCYFYPRIAFHQASEHVVVASVEDEKDLLHVEIYTKDGEFVRCTQIHGKRIGILRGMTVTTEGYIAVVYKCCNFQAKVLVM